MTITEELVKCRHGKRPLGDRPFACSGWIILRKFEGRIIAWFHAEDPTK